MSQSNSVEILLNAFKEHTVLVLGDVMLDHYVEGTVHRVSPEAPVPVLDVEQDRWVLGGAANVAANLKGLGAEVVLASVIGNDTAGKKMKALLIDEGISVSDLILSHERPTTVKTRLMSGHHQIARMDRETRDDLKAHLELGFINKLVEIIDEAKPTVIIFQDYNKGVLTPMVIVNVIDYARKKGIPTAVDPKQNNILTYKGCTLFKPNLREAEAALEKKLETDFLDSIKRACETIAKDLENDYTVLTLSEKGMYVAGPTEQELIPAYSRSVADVSGAGDTVIAVLSMALACKVDILAGAELANIAAGIVCSKKGVAPIQSKELAEIASSILA